MDSKKIKIFLTTAPAWQVLDTQDNRIKNGLTGWNLGSQQSAFSIQEAGGGERMKAKGKRRGAGGVGLKMASEG